MQLGVGVPSFASRSFRIPPSRVKRFARRAEEFEFAGLWTIEHLVRPPTYATSYLDSLTTLATLAGETDAIPLGTSILILPMREPVLVAKRAATIQHLADRRLTLGFGTGYVGAEFDAVGVPREERSARFLEGIELVRRLLTEDRVSFDGEFYSVEDFELEPRPSIPPRILTGGGGVDRDGDRHVRPAVTERLLSADGWIAPPRPLDTLAADWAAFEARLEAEGRDPDDLEKVALQYLHLVPGADTDRALTEQRRRYRRFVGEGSDGGDTQSQQFAFEANWLTGSVADVREHLAGYREQGFDEVVLYPVPAHAGELDRQLRLWNDLLRVEYP